MVTSEQQVRYGWKAVALAFALAAMAASVKAQRRPAATEPPSVIWKNVLTGKPSDYVKSVRTCEHCHRAEVLEFEKTPHSQIKLPAGNPVASCAICHGPEAAHVVAEEAAAGDVAKMEAGAKLIFSFHGNPKENAERCLACHSTSIHQQDFSESAHFLHGVSCNECHSMHLVRAIEHPNAPTPTMAEAAFYEVPKLPIEQRWLHESLLKKSQPALCYQCHGDVRAQFAMPFHHRVPEGLMNCTSCHTPHGAITTEHQLNQPGFQTCIKCHIEVAGPFVYEHAAVKIEGCVACHNPHGSPNHFMLVRRETRFLCLQCHTGFHNQAVTPHGPSTSFENWGDCTRCHIAIHGSDFDPDFIR